MKSKPENSSLTKLQNLTRESKRLFNENQYQETITKCEEIIKLYPKNIAAHWRLAISLDRTNNKQQAIEVLEQIIKLDSNIDLAYAVLAKIKDKLGDRQAAILEYKKAINLNPNQPDWVFIELGKAIGNTKARINKHKKLNLVIFGNCQAPQLAAMLQPHIDLKKYSLRHLSNNSRSEGFMGKEKTFEVLSKADILICQALGFKHGSLSINCLRESLGNRCKIVTFPYIFNSGIASLCYAPYSFLGSYGKIYGGEAIIDCISKNGLEATIEQFKQGAIDFSLKERFELCLNESKLREKVLDIKLTDYIINNYQSSQLFVTYAHPTKTLYIELVRQLLEIIDLGHDSQRQKQIDYRNISEQIDTGGGYSPYDVIIHKYKFGYHSDWQARGIQLIKMIYRAHFAEENVTPEIYPSKIIYPDMQLATI